MTGYCSVKKIRSKFAAVSEATELLSEKSVVKNETAQWRLVRQELWGKVVWLARVREIIELVRDADFAAFQAKSYLSYKSEKKIIKECYYLVMCLYFVAQLKDKAKELVLTKTRIKNNRKKCTSPYWSASKHLSSWLSEKIISCAYLKR